MCAIKCTILVPVIVLLTMDIGKYENIKFLYRSDFKLLYNSTNTGNR